MNELKPIKKLVAAGRIAICEECDLFRPILRRCAMPPKGCGCFIASPLLFGKGKAYLMGHSCPNGKWQAMTSENLIELHNELAAGGDE